jgi:hypothetical protein
MDKMKSIQNRRVRNLIIIFALTAVIVSVSTYAWFIGMRTVGVSSFDVNISSTESLMLSLDGVDWDYTVSINEDTVSPAKYPGNTNWWAGRGLIPMSTVGQIDPESSRLMLYEKSSFTATPGGYRLLASQVENQSENQDGYVAFDLFIRNFTGADYIVDLNRDDEEAIYLTVDSEVNVHESGGVAGTGIENSVRVAFAEIGRVIGTETDAEIIQGITCKSDTNVTGICSAATIWEPNDTSHVDGAIGWYETSCRKRTGSPTKALTSYDLEVPCGTVIDGLAYPTYAINKPIPSGSNVDIYDGPAFNGYVSDVEGEKDFLEVQDTFTDTMKYFTGTKRPTFITLAPNSITKVRVYIFIEGQDIDNYDFSSIGKQIQVNFGFTKERFTEDDFDYPGADANQGLGPDDIDLTAPRITLVGDEVIELTVGSPFTDEGATAYDNIDEDVTDNIQAVGTVNTDVAGTYRITYKVRDTAGNLGIKTRTIIVSE